VLKRVHTHPYTLTQQPGTTSLRTYLCAHLRGTSSPAGTYIHSRGRSCTYIHTYITHTWEDCVSTRASAGCAYILAQSALRL